MSCSCQMHNCPECSPVGYWYCWMCHQKVEGQECQECGRPINSSVVHWRSTPTWDDTFIEMCTVMAKRSKDPSSKLGCVIIRDRVILSTGYNGPPRGVSDDKPERFQRPEKYRWFEHAERNAIYNAARIGVSLEESTLYIPGAPCEDCARAIVQVGIGEVVLATNHIPDRWYESAYRAWQMFDEAAIKRRLQNTNGKKKLSLVCVKTLGPVGGFISGSTLGIPSTQVDSCGASSGG